MIAIIKTSIIIIMLSIIASSAYMAKCYNEAKLQQEQQTVILQQMYDKMAESDVVSRSWGDYREED